MYDYETTGLYCRAPWGYYEKEIKTVVLTNGITSIGAYAFYNCDAIESVTVPGSVKTLNKSAFSSCQNIKTVVLEDGVEIIGENAFYGNTALTDIRIPSTVTTIGNSAFYGNNTLTDGVTTIGEKVFFDCNSLTSVVLPESLTSLDWGVFSNCRKLESITLPGSIGVVRNNMFQNCTGLENEVINEGVTLIEWGAFRNCGIKTMTLPKSLTEFEDGVIDDCDYITDVYFAGSREDWLAIKFGLRNYFNGATVHYGIEILESVSVEVATPPTKLTYTVGDQFDSTGLTLEVTYNDGTTEIITEGFTVSAPDMSVAGTKYVTINYQNLTTTFTITVEEIPTAKVGTIVVESATVKVGEQVTIPVKVEKTDLGTLAITVNYDATKLSFVSLNDVAFDLYDINTDTAGVITIAAIDSSSVAEGAIFSITFDVVATETCTTEVAVEVEEAYDGNDEEVIMDTTKGLVDILKIIKGDVNGDGGYSVSDARWVLQSVSGNREFTAEQLAAADVNGDGKVSIIDARWILQASVGNREI